MKISKVGSDKSVSKPSAKKSSPASGADFVSELKKAAETQEPKEVTETAVTQPVDAVLAIQEVSDQGDQKSRNMAKEYGLELLDRLERIREGLLIGAIPKQELTDLAQAMRQQRRQTDDPQLNAIIDEIELRAEIEIAKLTRSAR